jgi:hypothetical protein
MPDCVVDTSVLAFANGDIAGRRPGNLLDQRLGVLEQIVGGARRLRYNPKLLDEYQKLITQYRNDVIETVFAILDDTRRSVRVTRSSLSRQDRAKAADRCHWPDHDQHLLAAAIGGDYPSIVVTEDRLNQRAAAILRHFEVRIEHLG